LVNPENMTNPSQNGCFAAVFRFGEDEALTDWVVRVAMIENDKQLEQ
jgi:hypothetical protein